MLGVTEISAIVAAVGVLVGVVYYILDMRNQAKLRQTDMVMRLYDKFGSPEFQKVLQHVVNLGPEDAESYVRNLGTDSEVSSTLYSIAVFFEGVGVLVKRKLINMDLVDDLFSTAIKQFWEKTAFFAKEARVRRKSSAIGEWNEYLYNEMKKREQTLQQSKT